MSKTFKTLPQLLEENKRLLRDKKRLYWLLSEEGQQYAWEVLECMRDNGELIVVNIDAAMEAAK